jgi:hypothetical protein
MFQCNILPLPSGFKTEAVCSSKMLVTIYQITWCHNLYDYNINNVSRFSIVWLPVHQAHRISVHFHNQWWTTCRYKSMSNSVGMKITRMNINDYEADLRFISMQSIRCSAMFQRNSLPSSRGSTSTPDIKLATSWWKSELLAVSRQDYSSVLKMEAVCSFKVSAKVYRTVWCYIHVGNNLQYLLWFSVNK